MEENCKTIEEEIRNLQMKAKQLQQGIVVIDQWTQSLPESELNKIKSKPNDEELSTANDEYGAKVIPG